MKKLSKTLSVLLTAAIMLALLPTGVAARAESGTCGENVTWTLENGVLTIGGTGDMADASGFARFAGEVNEIVIEGGVTSVCENAFYGFSAMTNMTLSEGVARIEAGAFYGCTGLKAIDIPGSVKYLAPDAFRRCTNVERINVAIANTVYISYYECVVEIATNTLIMGCKGSLVPVGMEIKVTSIGDGAFRDCTGLLGMGVTSNITRIGDYAFANCSSMIYTNIPGSVTDIGVSAYEGCVGLTGDFDISEGVINIGDAAFRGCTGFNTITIPKSVKTIGESVFDGCNALTLRVYEYSLGWEYAIANNIPYEVIGVALAKGDPDGDGDITVADALSALRVAARLVEPTPKLLYSCDVADNDGVITVNDALRILRVAARLADPSSLIGEEPVSLSGIEVTTPPTKTTYDQGEALDVSGGEITLYYSDGASEVIPITEDMVSGFDSSVAGTNTITVSYGGKTATFRVIVEPSGQSDAVQVKVETVRATPGDSSVEVKLLVTAEPKWNGIALSVSFDTDALMYKGYSKNPVINEKYSALNPLPLLFMLEERDGRIMCVFSSDDEAGNSYDYFGNAYDYLFIMRFDVAEEVSGMQNITVSVDRVADNNTEMPFTQENGGILVA